MECRESWENTCFNPENLGSSASILPGAAGAAGPSHSWTFTEGAQSRCLHPGESIFVLPQVEGAKKKMLPSTPSLVGLLGLLMEAQVSQAAASPKSTPQLMKAASLHNL